MTSGWTWVIPEHFNIGAACIQAAEAPETFEKTAVIVDDAEQGVRALTYGHLAGDVKGFSSSVREYTDKGDRVLIQLPNCVEYPVAFLGILYAGRIAVPASILLMEEELCFLLNDSGARMAILDARYLPDLKTLIKACPALESVVVVGFTEGLLPGGGASVRLLHWQALLEERKADSLPEATRAEEPAYLVYTSGTTGYPKGVLHAHRSLLGRMPASRYWFHFEGDNDRILHSGKFNWTYVLGTALMDPLSQGKTVVLNEGDASPERWIDLIARHDCSIFIGVPTLYRQILQKTSRTRQDVPTLRHCMSAGEHLSDEVLTQWQRRFGLPIYEAVGMSECSYYLSHHVGAGIRPGSAGFPQPGHEIQLLDESLEPVPVGEEGMIGIPESDPALFLRYWNLPEETAATRKGGYFLTGDFARQDRDGYWWFLGRKDDLINSFGYRVSPVEVERVLKGHPDVADCAVTGHEVAPDKVIVVACVICHDSAHPTEEALLEWAATRLARYKLPRRIEFMQRFPRTRNGKVLRSALLSG